MSDAEKIIHEAIRASWEPARGNIGLSVPKLAELTAEYLRAAGYEVVKPEWEYGHRYTNESGDTTTRRVTVTEFHGHKPTSYRANREPYWNYEQVRRRKAGVWQTVEGAK